MDKVINILKNQILICIEDINLNTSVYLENNTELFIKQRAKKQIINSLELKRNCESAIKKLLV